LCFPKRFVFDVDQLTIEKFRFYQTASWGAFARKSTNEMLEQKMKRTTCYSAVAAAIPVWLLSVSILIFGAEYSVAQAQAKSRHAAAVACGQELKKQCSGVPVKANNMLECLQTAQVSARCAALAHHVVRMCERDAVHRCEGVVAGQGNILGCLTTAKGVVSARCNAALDAAFLR
jgi:hypothetical protein